MTQKYKKEEKANKYIYRVPYQKNKTLSITETRNRFLVLVLFLFYGHSTTFVTTVGAYLCAGCLHWMNKPRNMPRPCTPHAAAQLQPIHALRTTDGLQTTG